MLGMLESEKEMAEKPASMRPKGLQHQPLSETTRECWQLAADFFGEAASHAKAWEQGLPPAPQAEPKSGTGR
jgi:hypothetical protein